MPVANVIEALKGEGPILKDWVLAWMDEPDIRTRGAVYELTRRAWSRITPELSMREQCSFMADYLIECLLTDPDESEWGHSAFLAGYEIAAWLRHLHGIPGTSLTIGAVAQELTHGYRQADTSTRKPNRDFLPGVHFRESISAKWGTRIVITNRRPEPALKVGPMRQECAAMLH